MAPGDRQDSISIDVGDRTYDLTPAPSAETGELYWNRLWPASVGLAQYLFEQKREVLSAGPDVLELGCGATALAGITAADLGARVTCTDVSLEALRLARQNATQNDVVGLEVRVVDWFDPPDISRCEWVIGADLIYDVSLVEPFANTLDAMLAPNGAALLADAIRSPFDVLLIVLNQRGFEHRQVLLDIEIGGRSHRVGVYEVNRVGEARPGQGTG